MPTLPWIQPFTPAALLVLSTVPAAVAQVEDCPVVTASAPEFSLPIVALPTLAEPGSTMKIEVSVLVDSAGRPTDVEVLRPAWIKNADSLSWLRERLANTARAWRFSPTDAPLDERRFQLNFFFRSMLWSTPKEQFQPRFDGCNVEVRRRAFAGRFARIDDIPEPYRRFYEYDEATPEFPYERITLQRPGAVVVFHRDGRAEFTGSKYEERVGAFIGNIRPAEYGMLCYALERVGFFEFSSRYSELSSHGGTVTLRVLDAETGNETDVSEYARQGPPELWLLVKAINGLVAEIEWSSKENPKN